jgi:hypothetical protein
MTGDRQDRTGRKWIGKMGQAEHGLVKRDSQNRIGRMGQAEQEVRE